MGIGVIWASQVAYWYKLLAPQMVESHSTLEKELPKFIPANSITLTPSTVMVRVEVNPFLVRPSRTPRLLQPTPLTMILETIGTLAISGLPLTRSFISKTLLATYSAACPLIILSLLALIVRTTD